jgi:hypothetical protein
MRKEARPSIEDPGMTVNAVIFIHGVTTEFKPPEPITRFYKPMWASIASQISDFKASSWLPIFVTWGNVFPGDKRPFRPDQKLSLAEQQTSLATQKKVQPMNGAKRDFGWPVMRQDLMSIRNKLLRGLSDVIYYTSGEGEAHVRKVVYGQVLTALKPLLKKGYSVRLHVIAHSLGNAVAHDFLYSIFNTHKTPDFSKYQAKAADKIQRKTFLYLRELARGRAPRVSFGSFSSMASPIPIFVLRKQAIVERLSKRGATLDPAQIGIKEKRGGVQWKLFYDKDDLLAFPTRSLYKDPHGAIGDYHVSTGWLPVSAHMGYWGNEDVRRETAELLGRRRL